MSDAATILKMIETVSPDDTAKMDEIDAYVYGYAEHYRAPVKTTEILRYRNELPKAEFHFYDVHNWVYKTEKLADIPEYTRSRDALKAIRPEGWSCHHYTDDKWQSEIHAVAYKVGFRGHKNKRTEKPLPTEELAELHAIIKAIEYERNQNDKR